MTGTKHKTNRGWIGCILAIFMGMCQASESIRADLVEDAPNVYVVKDGDTLWDIACQFLHNPWRWQQIWYKNPDIEDPDLIYPGDKIVLFYENGAPRLKVERWSSTTTIHSSSKVGGVVKLRPRVRSYPAAVAIPTIPLKIIGPFFNHSRVITHHQAHHCPLITGLDEDHLVVGAGDIVYVGGLSPRIQDTIFDVIRPGKVYKHPKTKEPLGIEGIMLGKVELDKRGDPARMIVSESLNEIAINDRIIGTEIEKIDPYFKPKAPFGPARGYIISLFGGVNKTDEYKIFKPSAIGINRMGQYQIVVVTGGKDIKRETGDVLAIFQKPQDPPKRFKRSKYSQNFPSLNVGTMVVFRVFDRVSYALIMNSTRGIYLLDEVGRP